MSFTARWTVTQRKAFDFSHLGAKGVGYARHRSRLKEVIEVRTLPPKMVQALAPFAPLFSKRVWQHAQLLLVGAILAPGRRTVSSALRAMGLDQEKRFHRYHRVLSRARWSSLRGEPRPLGACSWRRSCRGGPLVVGIDETLERRYGKKISARGVYRDPVRSTHETFVKSSGLRWVCAMLLVEVPWASEFGPCPSSGLGPFRALCRPARQTAQEDNRVGLAAALGAKALVPTSGDSGRRRSRLRFAQAARSLPQALRSDHLRHPLALGCRPLRTGPAAPPRPDREAAPQGRALAQPFRGGPRSCYRLGAHQDRQLVRERGAHGRDRFRDGRVVLHGLVRRAHPLGLDPRSRRRFKIQALLCTDLEADPEKILSGS